VASVTDETPDGGAYQKDLGSNTGKIAGTMTPTAEEVSVATSADRDDVNGQPRLIRIA
jgi:hypothetical protein